MNLIMAQLDVSQLIALAIGSPQPEYLKSKALQFLLSLFAEKLQIMHEPVKFDQQNILDEIPTAINEKEYCKRKERLAGGADPEEGEAEPEPAPEDEKDPDVTEFTENIEATGEEEARGEGQSDASEPSENKAAPIEEIETETKQGSMLIQTNATSHEKSVKEQETDNKTDSQTAPASQSRISENISDVSSGSLEETKAGDMYPAICVMKEQLEVTMKEVLLLAEIAIEKKPDEKILNTLRSLSKKMISMQAQNVYIENALECSLRKYSRFNISEEEEEEEEEVLEEEFKAPTTPSEPQPDNYGLDEHLCYSPEKIFDQVVDLKSTVCMLENKVKEVTTTLVEEERERTANLMKTLTEQLDEMTQSVSGFKDMAHRMQLSIEHHLRRIEELRNMIIDLKFDKVDKSELSAHLVEKADTTDMRRRALRDEVNEMQCQIRKQICEVEQLVQAKDKQMYDFLQNIRVELGLTTIEETLAQFKEGIDKEINSQREELRKYVELTNDECVAAGVRVKVQAGLSCLSCDTTCTMKKVERAKVGKLASVRPLNTPTPNPLLMTHNHSTIRKSGIRGYYLKGDFQNPFGAAKRQQKAPFGSCVPRHAGGPHTTFTAQEHLTKVLRNK